MQKSTKESSGNWVKIHKNIHILSKDFDLLGIVPEKEVFWERLNKEVKK